MWYPIQESPDAFKTPLGMQGFASSPATNTGAGRAFGTLSVPTIHPRRHDMEKTHEHPKRTRTRHRQRGFQSRQAPKTLQTRQTLPQCGHVTPAFPEKRDNLIRLQVFPAVARFQPLFRYCQKCAKVAPKYLRYTTLPGVGASELAQTRVVQPTSKQVTSHQWCDQVPHAPRPDVPRPERVLAAWKGPLVVLTDTWDTPRVAENVTEVLFDRYAYLLNSQNAGWDIVRKRDCFLMGTAAAVAAGHLPLDQVDTKLAKRNLPASNPDYTKRFRKLRGTDRLWRYLLQTEAPCTLRLRNGLILTGHAITACDYHVIFRIQDTDADVFVYRHAIHAFHREQELWARVAQWEQRAI